MWEAGNGATEPGCGSWLGRRDCLDYSGSRECGRAVPVASTNSLPLIPATAREAPQRDLRHGRPLYRPTNLSRLCSMYFHSPISRYYRQQNGASPTECSPITLNARIGNHRVLLSSVVAGQQGWPENVAKRPPFARCLREIKAWLVPVFTSEFYPRIFGAEPEPRSEINSRSEGGNDPMRSLSCDVRLQNRTATIV